mgnify:CR=1 FL=1
MAYIGTSPSNGVRRRFVYEATANQTSFSGNDESGITLTYVDSLYLDVYQNGVKLKAGDDYTATTGTTVVLVQGASADDVLEMVAFDVFSVNDSVSASAGGSFAGAIGMGSTLAVTGNATVGGTLGVTGVTTGTIIKGTTSLQTPLIEFTDGDDAIAIADGGVVTLLTTAVAKSEGGAVTTNIAQGLAKAWLRLNGTGTIAIRDSFGISGVTDNTTGTTTAAFSNDFSNDEFATTGMHSSTAFSMQVVVTNTVGSVKFRTLDGSGSLINDGAHSIAVHGDQA